jgi:hypothetical protein
MPPPPHFQYSSPDDRRKVTVFQLCQQLALQGLRKADPADCRKLLQLQNADTHRAPVSQAAHLSLLTTCQVSVTYCQSCSGR